MKTDQEIKQFEKLAVQLEKMLNDFSELSKKRPNDAVNKFKLELVNSLLDCANGIIDEGDRPFSGFLRFNEDTVPTNSDVLVIMSQYRVCLERFFRENIEYRDYDQSVWIVGGKPRNIHAPDRYKDLL